MPAVHAVDAVEAIARCPILDPAVIVGGIVEPDARDIDVHAPISGFNAESVNAVGGSSRHRASLRFPRKGDEWVIESPTGASV